MDDKNTTATELLMQMQQAKLDIEQAAMNATIAGTGVYQLGRASGTDCGSAVSNSAHHAGINIRDTNRNNALITFQNSAGMEVGRLDFNGDELRFDGAADQAALVFIQWCRRTWNDQRIAERTSLLNEVMESIIQEASSELYDDAEKVALMTAAHRVLEIRQGLHERPVEQMDMFQQGSSLKRHP